MEVIKTVGGAEPALRLLWAGAAGRRRRCNRRALRLHFICVHGARGSQQQPGGMHNAPVIVHALPSLGSSRVRCGQSTPWVRGLYGFVGVRANFLHCLPPVYRNELGYGAARTARWTARCRVAVLRITWFSSTRKSMRSPATRAMPSCYGAAAVPTGGCNTRPASGEYLPLARPALD